MDVRRECWYGAARLCPTWGLVGVDTATTHRQAPRGQKRIFHGWWIVLVAFLASFVSAGVGGYGLGVFLKPMTADLGWTRTQFAWFSPIRAVVMGVTGPLLGPMVDRKQGARILFVAGGLVAGVGIMLMYNVNALLYFYIVMGLVWGFGQALLGGNIISGPIVSKWFVRRRGRAMAIYAMGISGGGVVFVPLNAFLIETIGWRSTWVVLAFIVWILLVPLALVVMRRQPEDIGLLPDGDRPAANDSPGAPLAPAPMSAAAREVSWTVGLAARTPSLWLLIIAFNLMTMSIGATLLNQFAYLTDKELGVVAVTTAATGFGWVAMLGKVPWGMLAERFEIRYVASSCFTIAGIGLLSLVVATDARVIVLYVLLYGLGAGGGPVLQNVIWANYYGRQFQGTIRGVFAPLNLLGMGFSPVFATWIRDSTGSYDTAFLVLMGGCLTGAVLILMARAPVHPSRRAGAGQESSAAASGN